MDQWKDRVAVVTGGSCGIGAATAKALVEHGMKVVICARNFEKLQAFATELKAIGKGEAHPIKCDVTKEEEILAMFEEVNNKYGGVDVMINNAGLAHNAPMLTGKTDDWRNMLDVNVLAVAVCGREAIMSMKQKGVDDGYVININSFLCHQIVPGFPMVNFYAATKFAVNAMTEALRVELREAKSNIRVSQICPGGVQTEFVKRAFGWPDDTDPYTRLPAKDVADLIISTLATPPHVQIHEVIVRPIYQEA